MLLAFFAEIEAILVVHLIHGGDREVLTFQPAALDVPNRDQPIPQIFRILPAIQPDTCNPRRLLKRELRPVDQFHIEQFEQIGRVNCYPLELVE